LAPRWSTAVEITDSLRKIFPDDPARVDFSLSRLGILELCQKRYRKSVCELCSLRPVCRVANRNLKNNQFSIWLERMAKERLPAIIKYFGQISLDGVLTAEEIAGFNKLLDRLFFSMVIVREEILSGEME
jgi:hypothetical protein